MRGMPPASGGTSRIVWPYSDTSSLVDLGGGPPLRHHALDLVPHRDRRGGVRLRPPRGPCTRGSARRPRWRRPAAPPSVAPESNTPLPITSATASTDQGEGHTDPEGQPGRRSASHRTAPRRRRGAGAPQAASSRFACVAGPTSTSSTCPPGPTMKVVGGAVTP